MEIIIKFQNKEKIFTDKIVIMIGTNDSCNFKLNLKYPVLLTIKYDFSLNNYVISNTLSNKKILFCRNPLSKLELGQFNKLSFADSEEYLIVKVLQRQYA